MNSLHFESTRADGIRHMVSGASWNGTRPIHRRIWPFLLTRLLLFSAAWGTIISNRCLADESPQPRQHSAAATLEAIRDAWQTRQNAIQSAEFIWKEKRLYPKGTRTDEAIGNFGVYPPHDVQVEIPAGTFRFDGDKYYYETMFYQKFDDLSRDGEKWIWFFDGVEKNCWPRDRRIIIQRSERLFNVTGDALCLMLPFRPLEPGGIGIDVGAASVRDRTEVVDNIECIVLDETLTQGQRSPRTYWLDQRRGYLPLRCSDNFQGETYGTIDIRYTDTTEFGPIPQSWTITKYRSKQAPFSPGGIEDHSQSQVTSWKINSAMEASQLTVAYEPGMTIQDNRVTDGSMLSTVLPDGTLQPITKRSGLDDGSGGSKWRNIILIFVAGLIFAGGVWLVARGLRDRARR